MVAIPGEKKCTSYLATSAQSETTLFLDTLSVFLRLGGYLSDVSSLDAHRIHFLLPRLLQTDRRKRHVNVTHAIDHVVSVLLGTLLYSCHRLFLRIWRTVPHICP